MLPQLRTRSGTGQSVKDLTEHPFAGADVAMTLVAHDQSGNEGRSEPFQMKLPERPFFNLLAKSLIELRRMLALDAETRTRVLLGLETLSIAPDKFIPEYGIYLGLRSVYWNLVNAKSDDELREVVSRMWALAVSIEDGNLGDAATALRAAEQALRQALERDAPDEEIKRLTDQLRAAINNYLQALAREMRKNPEQLAQPLDPNSRILRSQDLQDLLNQLENLARSGNREAARRLLQQLQSMLDNLQMVRPGGSGGDQDMQMLSELAEIIGRQRRLRDRTYQQGQDLPRDGEPGDPDQLGELRQDQGSLRDQLAKLLEQLRERGYGLKPETGQQGQGDLDQFGRAGEAMGDAEGSLGEGNADSAVDSQGRALEALRKGAQNLAQSMMERRGFGQGPGEGRLGRARAGDDTDPLGRPLAVDDQLAQIR
ncbi:MAG: TIGR02302 family protein, partial [Xanthobacteraceae bacterium]